MADERPLTDDEAHARLVAAAEALGYAPGLTTRANTALTTARTALVMLQLGLVKAQDDDAALRDAIENG